MLIPSRLQAWLKAIAHHPLARHALLLFIPLGCYAAVFLVPFPFPLRPLSVAARYSFLTTLVGAGVVLSGLFSLRGWLGRLTALSGVMVLFALSLLGLWVSGQSTSTVFGSLLPLYDAAEYYQDAQRLLAGGGFYQFSSWRPLFPGLLALILAVTGNHLQVTLAILGIFPAVACFWFAREVQRAHGLLAAVMALLILFFFYRQRVSGMVLSEHLGLAFGALGLALAWRSAAHNDWRLLGLGIFVQGLGLNTRPGAFFLLPALVLWGAWAFRGQRRISWPVFGVGALAAAASFLANSFVLRLVAAEPSMLFSNFAYTLYGLVNGGRHFSSAVADHPELLAMQGSERFAYTYGLVLESFLRNPLGIVRGALSEWSLFFSNTGYSVFSYMAAESPLVTRAARVALYAFSLVGLARCIIRRSDPYHSLAGMAAAAVFLSVPFVPPGDAYGLRLYAATLPVIAVLPALGLSFLSDRLSQGAPWFRPASGPSAVDPGLAGFSVFVAAVVVLAPILVKLFWSRPVAAPQTTCPPGLETLYVRLHPGSFVNVHPESEFFLDRLPDFHQGRFSRQTHGMPDAELAQVFDRQPAPITYYRVIDVTDFRPAWLMIDPGLLPARQGFFRLCGRWDSTPLEMDYYLFAPERVDLLK